MELNLQTPEGTSGVIQVADEVFAKEFNEALIHQVVTAYLAHARSGTHAQKNRAQVRGGGRKPWRQKGTGRARAGTIRSPLWRGGGVVFAATPGNYSQKLNKKMYRGAMRSIVSELVRQERLVVVENLTIEAPKTRLLLAKLAAFKLQKVLIVTEQIDNHLYLAARNLYQVNTKEVSTLDPVSLIGFDKVLITVSALRKLEEQLT